MIMSNVYLRVFRIQFAERLGTMFAMDVDDRQYLVSARHVIEGAAGDFALEVFREGDWKTLDVTLVGHSDEGDVSVFATDISLAEKELVVEPTMAGLMFAQTVYFLGFPYGMYGDHPQVNRGFPMPFAKTATVSMFDKENHKVIYLDGINNEGFSGGPVAFPLHGTNKWQFAGVISGYESVAAPVSLNGNATELSYAVNTGLIRAVPISLAVELARAKPIGHPQ